MVLAVLSPVHAAPPSAVSGVPKTCDSEFYDVMSNRAWLESSREMEVAQTLINKPDSVLEYTCFDEILKKTGAAGFADVDAIYIKVANLVSDEKMLA